MAFPCTKCDKKYSEHKNLVAHENSKHSEEIEIFHCPQAKCNTTCNSKYSMANHNCQFHKKNEEKLKANMKKFIETIKNERKFNFFFSFFIHSSIYACERYFIFHQLFFKFITSAKPLKSKTVIRKSAKCETCGTTFSCRGNLNKHVKNFHPTPGGKTNG